jgi:hypothetical protein
MEEGRGSFVDSVSRLAALLAALQLAAGIELEVDTICH